MASMFQNKYKPSVVMTADILGMFMSSTVNTGLEIFGALTTVHLSLVYHPHIPLWSTIQALSWKISQHPWPCCCYVYTFSPNPHIRISIHETVIIQRQLAMPSLAEEEWPIIKNICFYDFRSSFVLCSVSTSEVKEKHWWELDRLILTKILHLAWTITEQKHS